MPRRGGRQRPPSNFGTGWNIKTCDIPLESPSQPDFNFNGAYRISKYCAIFQNGGQDGGFSCINGNYHKNSYREAILEISTSILTACTKRNQSSISRKSIRHFGFENAKMAALKPEVVLTQAAVEISTPFQMLNWCIRGWATQWNFRRQRSMTAWPRFQDGGSQTGSSINLGPR